MREVIHSLQAPAAIGPYSQAIEVKGPGKMVFLSGQVAINPATGNLLDADTAGQTEQVMANLKAVLEAARLTFADVVKCTIYLVDLGDFAKVNEVYGRCFPHHPPARATVQVAALPKGARVEIDAIAVAV